MDWAAATMNRARNVDRVPLYARQDQHVISLSRRPDVRSDFWGLGRGNGDASWRCTAKRFANQHKLAACSSGVLDNFYDRGDVSGTGMCGPSAFVSDYVEKTWPAGYAAANTRTTPKASC